MSTGTQLTVDVMTLRSSIESEYAEVAATPDKGFHFHVGRTAAERLNYPATLLDEIPESAVESFAGVGNPFELGDLNSGESVVDLGSGAGLDTFIAGQMVGTEGHVMGIDMTPDMLKKARANAEIMGQPQVRFRKAYLEELPIPDNSIDVAVSNGVYNLVPDKPAAYAEVFRVLKPGGRMQFSDIVLTREVPGEAKADIDLWTG